MEPEPHKQPIRFYEIDLLRFLAAISVVLYHYTFWGITAKVTPVSFPALAPFTMYGYLGVELFFIISGYVVLLSAQGKTVRQFFRSRITRLYPAFWAACTATFVVERLWSTGVVGSALTASMWQYLFNMTMLHEFFGVVSVDGAYWSLAVEITFYFLVSLLIAYRLMRHLDLMLSLWLLYVVAASTATHLGASQTMAGFSVLFFPSYAPFFVAGMLFYLFQEPGGRTWYRYVLLGASYLLALRSSVNQSKILTAIYHVQFSFVVVCCIITLFFIIFLLIAFQKVRLNRFSWLKWPGALTYPLYLLHENIGYLLFFHVADRINKYVLLGGTVLLMLGLAYLLHILIEKPVSKRLGTLVTWLLGELDGATIQPKAEKISRPNSASLSKQ